MKLQQWFLFCLCGFVFVACGSPQEERAALIKFKISKQLSAKPHTPVLRMEIDVSGDDFYIKKSLLKKDQESGVWLFQTERNTKSGAIVGVTGRELKYEGEDQIKVFGYLYYFTIIPKDYEKLFGDDGFGIKLIASTGKITLGPDAFSERRYQFKASLTNYQNGKYDCLFTTTKQTRIKFDLSKTVFNITEWETCAGK